MPSAESRGSFTLSMACLMSFRLFMVLKLCFAVSVQ